MKNQNHSPIDSSKETIQTGISIHISEQTLASMQGEDIDFEVSVTRKNNKSLFKKLAEGLTKLKDYFSSP